MWTNVKKQFFILKYFVNIIFNVFLHLLHQKNSIFVMDIPNTYIIRYCVLKYNRLIYLLYFPVSYVAVLPYLSLAYNGNIKQNFCLSIFSIYEIKTSSKKFYILEQMSYDVLRVRKPYLQFYIALLTIAIVILYYCNSR